MHGLTPVFYSLRTVFGLYSRKKPALHEEGDTVVDVVKGIAFDGDWTSVTFSCNIAGNDDAVSGRYQRGLGVMTWSHYTTSHIDDMYC